MAIKGQAKQRYSSRSEPCSNDLTSLDEKINDNSVNAQDERDKLERTRSPFKRTGILLMFCLLTAVIALILMRLNVFEEEYYGDTEALLQVGSVTSDTSGSGPPRAKHGDLFKPGSLTQSRVETFRQCFADPTKYKGHFAPSFCSISEQWNLVYHLVPKSGSSTGRAVMKNSFGAVENVERKCQDRRMAHFSSANDTQYHFITVREPLSRFFASYEEMFVRVLESKDMVPQQFRKFIMPYEGMEYKQYAAMFQVPEGVNQLTRSFEEFVRDYDSANLFETHLRLQTVPLMNQKTGQAFRMDGIMETHNMDAEFAALAQKIQAPPPKMIRGRSYPRRFNTSDISPGTIRKICQLTAIDYCCLNFALPPECATALGKDEVHCRWVSKPELSDQLMIEAVTPFPPQ